MTKNFTPADPFLITSRNAQTWSLLKDATLHLLLVYTLFLNLSRGIFKILLVYLLVYMCNIYIILSETL